MKDADPEFPVDAKGAELVGHKGIGANDIHIRCVSAQNLDIRRVAGLDRAGGLSRQNRRIEPRLDAQTRKRQELASVRVLGESLPLLRGHRVAEPEISSQEVVPLLLPLDLKLLVVPNPFLQEPQAQRLQPLRRTMPRRPEIKTFQVRINPYPVTLHALVRVVEERKFRVERVSSGPS